MSEEFNPADLPSSLTKDLVQSSIDQFGEPVTTPMRKLHADEYTVNDLDGVTESATGSGNLNFLMMQAGQTNESMTNLNPFNVAGGDNLHYNTMNGAGGDLSPLPTTNNGFDTAMDRPFDGGNGFNGQSDFNALGNTNANAGTLGASNLAANTSSVNPFSDARNFSAASTSDTINNNPPIPPTNGTKGVSGTSGNDGASGSNGTNGNDGQDGNGGPITNIVNNFIDDTTTNLGDVINNTTTNLFDTINNTTNNITDIVNNIFNGNGLGPVGLSLDLVLDNLTNIKLDGILGDTITNILDETLNLAPVLDPVEALVGNLLSSTSLDILLNPFQPDNSPNDYDLHLGTNLDILGLQIPDLGIDVPLDIVEALVGDLDIGLDLTNDLLGGGGGNGDTDLALGGLGGLLDADVTNGIVETVLNPVENLIGDIDIGGTIGLGLLGLDSGQTGPDTDISLPINLGLIDNTLLGDTLEISLDPLENILGDIDLDLGVAGNVLGDVAAPLFDNIAGGNGANDLLNQIGDGLSDLAGHIIPVGAGGDTDLALNTGIDLLDNGLVDNGLGVVLNPVEDLVGDIDIGGTIGLDLLGTAQSGGADTDLTIPLDIGFIDNPILNDGIELNLDPLEAITGDIDLDLGVATNLLGNTADSLIDSMAGVSGTNDLLPQIGDGLSDLLAPVADGLSPSLEDTLDNIDIFDNDLLDTAIGLLDSAAPSAGGLDLGALTGGLTSGSDPLGGLTTWTETILPNAGDLLGGGLPMDPSSLIPDIITPVTSLPIPIVAPIFGGGGGLLGGLGGHGHHGGLFG